MKSAQFIFLILFQASPVSSKLLEDTGYGQALIRGDIDGCQKEYDLLGDLPREKALEVLLAKDKAGNTPLHYMAGMEGEARVHFQGEILRYSLTLMHFFQHFEIFDDWNRDMETPKDLAEKKGNSIAVEYLTLVENTAKEARSKRTSFDNNQAALLPPGWTSDSAFKELVVKKGVLGSISFANGALLFLTGMSVFAMTGDVSEGFGFWLVGSPMLILGAKACSEAFESWKQIKSGKN